MIGIRDAKPQEIWQLPGIEDRADAIYAAYPEFADFEGQCAVTPGSTAELPKHSTILVAENEAELVGFIYGHWMDDCFYIAQLSVVPEAQNQGIGSKLLAAIINAARQQDLKGLTLFTYKHLPFNAPFYAARGFGYLHINDVGRTLKQKYHEDTARWGKYGPRAIMGLTFEY